MHANVLGAMPAIPQVAPLVEAVRGRFAFISSRMGRIGEVQSSSCWTYRVSKAALNMAVASAQASYPTRRWWRSARAGCRPTWAARGLP